MDGNKKLIIGLMSFYATLVGTTAFMVGFVLANSNKDQIHVVELGVVDKIETLYKHDHRDKCRNIRFERRGYGGRLENIGKWSYYEITQKQFRRIKRQFVPGKKYIMTYRENNDKKYRFGKGALLSFYPKQ